MPAVTFKNPIAQLSDDTYKSLPQSPERAKHSMIISYIGLAATPICTAAGWFFAYKAIAARHLLAQKNVERTLLIANTRFRIPMPTPEVIEKMKSRNAMVIAVAVIVTALAYTMFCSLAFLLSTMQLKENQEIVQLSNKLSEHVEVPYWIELSTFETYFANMEQKLPMDSDDRLKCQIFKVYYQKAKNTDLYLRPESTFTFSSTTPVVLYAKGTFAKDQIKNDEDIRKALFG